MSSTNIQKNWNLRKDSKVKIQRSKPNCCPNNNKERKTYPRPWHIRRFRRIMCIRWLGQGDNFRWNIRLNRSWSSQCSKGSWRSLSSNSWESRLNTKYSVKLSTKFRSKQLWWFSQQLWNCFTPTVHNKIEKDNFDFLQIQVLTRIITGISVHRVPVNRVT